VRKIPSAEHKTVTLRGKIPAAEWETLSERNPHRRVSTLRTIKKKLVDMSALTPPSGGNLISGTYKYFSEWEKSQQWRNLVVASEWEISHLWGVWMDILL